MTPRNFLYMAERHKDRVRREDRRAGEIIALLYNINRDSKTDPKGMDWRDVFPEWKEKPGDQTEEEMFELMQLFAAKSTEGLSH